MSEGNSTVEYRDIQGEPGYRVGNDGTVWSCKTMGVRSVIGESWHKLHPSPHSAGYRVIVLRKGAGPTRMFFVHALVLNAFVGPCPEGMQCRHLDGIPHNNLLSNLCWGTPIENAHDKIRHGRVAFGEKHSYAKLKETDIAEIFRRRSEGETFVKIANDLKVTPGTIRAVWIGRSWKHIPRHLAACFEVGLL